MAGRSVADGSSSACAVQQHVGPGAHKPQKRQRVKSRIIHDIQPLSRGVFAKVERALDRRGAAFFDVSKRLFLECAYAAGNVPRRRVALFNAPAHHFGPVIHLREQGNDLVGRLLAAGLPRQHALASVPADRLAQQGDTAVFDDYVRSDADRRI